MDEPQDFRVRFVTAEAVMAGYTLRQEDRRALSSTTGYSWKHIEIICTMGEITGTTLAAEHLRRWICADVATRRAAGGTLKIEVL